MAADANRILRLCCGFVISNLIVVALLILLSGIDSTGGSGNRDVALRGSLTEH
jgi:hypothetical protein